MRIRNQAIGMVLLAQLMLASGAFADSCGGYCAGTTYHFCYSHPKTGDMQWRIYENSPKCIGHKLTDDTSELTTDSGFTGVKCSPPNHFTGDRNCCSYKNGIEQRCWYQ